MKIKSTKSSQKSRSFSNVNGIELAHQDLSTFGLNETDVSDIKPSDSKDKFNHRGWRQFNGLLLRFFLIKQRHPFATALDFLIPLLIILLIYWPKHVLQPVSTASER